MINIGWYKLRLIVRLLVNPIGIIIASWIFPNVNFLRWYEPIVLGVVYAPIEYLNIF